MAGRILNIHLKPKHGAPMQALASAQAVTGKGFKADVSFGRQKRQILLIESETLEEFGLAPGQVRENVTVEGVALAGLPVGTQVRIGEALLTVTGDCAPCNQMDAIRPGLQEAIDGRRGTLFRVLEGGAVKVGDPVIVMVPEPVA